MKKLPLTLLLTFLPGGYALADNPGLKPGLWESKVTRQVMDGRDMSAQMKSAQSQMQAAMANMPAAQRKQMESMMKGRPMPGANGATRICISPQMAARDKPMVDREGHCEPTKIVRSGSKTSFEFDCTSEGRHMVGHGDSVVSADSVSTRMDMTSTDAQGKHHMQTETQMSYLGADCQGIKPLDQAGSQWHQFTPRK